MRIRPPITDKEQFTLPEFREYVLNHIVVKHDCQMPVMDVFDETCEEYGEWQALDMFVNMWPYRYQMAVHGIFLEVILGRMSTIEREEPYEE